MEFRCSGNYVTSRLREEEEEKQDRRQSKRELMGWVERERVEGGASLFQVEEMMQSSTVFFRQERTARKATGGGTG